MQLVGDLVLPCNTFRVLVFICLSLFGEKPRYPVQSDHDLLYPQKLLELSTERKDSVLYQSSILSFFHNVFFPIKNRNHHLVAKLRLSSANAFNFVRVKRFQNELIIRTIP